MNILIEYCTQWNYEPRALRLGEILKNKFGINVTLLESSGGVFEVFLQKEPAGKDAPSQKISIFSKKELNRFPNQNEVEDLIEYYESVT